MNFKNAFTVDVEDYFQVEAFAQNIDRANWGSFEIRVERNTDKILQICDDAGIKGTFFVLGWVAKRYPAIVKKIVEQGHELASHGMSHKRVYTQAPGLFRAETRQGKQLLEDISGKQVKGYRAATYSITNESLWALEILKEEGFVYDSSIFPMQRDFYGIPDFNLDPHSYCLDSGEEIIEFPITVYKWNGLTIPVSGGGYFRLLPYFITRWGINSVNRSNRHSVFYLHPWEIDPDQPRIESAGLKSRFRHYLNLDLCERRLQRLLADVDYTTMEDVLQSAGLLRD